MITTATIRALFTRAAKPILRHCRSVTDLQLRSHESAFSQPDTVPRIQVVWSDPAQEPVIPNVPRVNVPRELAVSFFRPSDQRALAIRTEKEVPLTSIGRGDGIKELLDGRISNRFAPGDVIQSVLEQRSITAKPAVKVETAASVVQRVPDMIQPDVSNSVTSEGMGPTVTPEDVTQSALEQTPIMAQPVAEVPSATSLIPNAPDPVKAGVPPSIIMERPRTDAGQALSKLFKRSRNSVPVLKNESPAIVPNMEPVSKNESPAIVPNLEPFSKNETPPEIVSKLNIEQTNTALPLSAIQNLDVHEPVPTAEIDTSRQIAYSVDTPNALIGHGPDPTTNNHASDSKNSAQVGFDGGPDLSDGRWSAIRIIDNGLPPIKLGLGQPDAGINVIAKRIMTEPSEVELGVMKTPAFAEETYYVIRGKKAISNDTVDRTLRLDTSWLKEAHRLMKRKTNVFQRDKTRSW